MKKVKQKKNIPFLDYASNVGDYVQWTNLKGDRFTGTVIKWMPNDIAVIKMDDNNTINVQC